jgi:hypothetical protein
MAFEDYVQNPDPETKIWRYMDLPKFLSLLDKRALFFAQVKHLPDKSEGHMPGMLGGTDVGNMYKQMRDHHPTSWTTYLVVNCWHISNYEKDAMWGRYLASYPGIAVQSTVKRVSESLNISPLRRVYSGKVNYFDLEIKPGSEGVPTEFFYFHKRPEYEHDQEYRVLGDVEDIDLANHNGGVYVPSDMNTLIENIYTAPKSPGWFTELISSISKKYDVTAEIRPSRIGEDPLA